MPPKTKQEKYRCSCGCGRKVDRQTERRHLNPAQAPLYARLAQMMKKKTGQSCEAAQHLWQRAISHLSPTSAPNTPPAQSPPPADVDTSVPTANTKETGSPIQIDTTPILPHSPRIGGSPRPAIEEHLQSMQRAAMVVDEEDSSDEEDSGEDLGTEDEDEEPAPGDHEGGAVGKGDAEGLWDGFGDEEIGEEFWQDVLEDEDEGDGGHEADAFDEIGDDDDGEKETGDTHPDGADGEAYGIQDLPDDLRELISHLMQKLDVTDPALLRAWNWKMKHNVTDAAFNDLRFVAPYYKFPSAKTARRRIKYLARFRPEIYHCCVNSCMAYTGLGANLEQCLYCDEPRYRQDGKPRKIFNYIPLIPRLIALYMNADFLRKMLYRHTFEQKDGIIQDYCDALVYKHLREQKVVVGGVEQDYHYFEHETDVALALFTDGFAPFRNRKQTCWPLLIMNMNLPPDLRCLVENMLCVGVIPGPRKPKDADSFLYPFTLEMLELALGVDAFHILYKLPFSLRAFLMLLGGDMPAVAMILLMKGHNGICPCRMCKIIGVKKPNGKTYYVPLTPPESLQATHPTYTPDDLIRLMRTRDNLLEDGWKVQTALTQKASKELAKQCGVKGVPILSHLPSLILPQAAPYDYMHYMLANTFENLIKFFCGTFKDLDHAGQGYYIKPTVWQAIGEATKQSGATIPSAYGARPIDFSEDHLGLTCEMRAFWFTFLGPVFLEKSFAQPVFYDHFVRLIKLVNLCMQFEIKQTEIEEIRQGFATWVQDYEKLYYQYQDDRISACPLTIHALLHIADGIEYMGPVWVYWAFAMERYCGKLARMIKSRRFPFANLDNQVLAQTQLQCIASHHNIHTEIALRPPPPPTGTIVLGPEYSNCRFLAPCRAFDITSKVNYGMKKSIASALVTRYSAADGKATLNRQTALKVLDRTEVLVYGRLKKLGWGDTMLASKVVTSNEEDRRDATFVRYECLVDRYQEDHDANPEYYGETNYGQLQYIFLLKIPAHANIEALKERQTVVLGAIQPCNIIRHHPQGLDIHYYRTMSAKIDIVDVNYIQCLVGRTKWNKQWAIFDRSGSAARAFAEDDD